MTEPRIRIEPHRIDTDGTAAALLMEEYANKLDAWQELVLNAWLGKDEQGNYTAINCGLSVPRQNGKTEILIARTLYGLLVNGERILFTSHQQRSSKQVFMRLLEIFTDKRHPEICEQVKKTRLGIGEEGIFLNNGASVEFTSRTRQTARGYAGLSLIVLDECQTANDEELAAIMATLSASPTQNRQLIYCGTPPTVGDSGEVFKRFRQSCIASAERNEEQANSWHEWGVSAESLEEIELSNREIWYKCNPALGTGRLSEIFTEQEYKIQAPGDFARERLGYWAKPKTTTQETVISPELWNSCKSAEQKPSGKTAYGVKFKNDGSEVILAGAVIPNEGPARIALIDARPTGEGLNWLSTWLNARYKEASVVVIDGKNGADVLIEKLRPSGGGTWAFKDSIIKPSAQNVVTAASTLLNELCEHTITWYEQQEMLTESAITSIKRPISGGWGFGGSESAPIEACSLALWGVRTSKRNPQRVMRLG